MAKKPAKPATAKRWTRCGECGAVVYATTTTTGIEVCECGAILMPVIKVTPAGGRGAKRGK